MTVPIAQIAKKRKSNRGSRRTAVGTCTLTLKKRMARSGILGRGAMVRKIDNGLG
jgi:hypothetical protein